MKKMMFVLVMLALCSGCLEKDVTQTLYIEADGAVTWEVLELDVYSSSKAAEDRNREEAEYLAAAIVGRPSIVEALEAIGGIDVRSQLLRDRRPYAVRATAHFPDLGTALGGFTRATGIDATVQFEIDGPRRTLTITPAEFELQPEDESVSFDLLSSDGMRFVLSVGTFEETEGFVIADGGRAAVWAEETEEESEDFKRLRLVWSVPDVD
jgi:hypothetical protein